MNDANVLVRYYREHVAAPDDAGSIYGYWTVVAGAALSLGAVVTYVAAELFVAGPAWDVRRVSIATLFLATPVFVAGVANLLPGGHWTGRISLVGILPAVLAAVGVVRYYPQQFNVADGSDVAPELVALLAFGLSIQLLVVAAHPLLADRVVADGEPGDASHATGASQPADAGRSAEHQGGKGRF